MPRPLNWIRGEGTVKNQRWGLGSLMDTPFIPKLGFSGLGNCPGDPGCPGYVVPNSPEYIASLQNELGVMYNDSVGAVDTYFNQQVDANNSAVWLQKNTPLLIIGGIIGLMLIRR